MERVSVVVGRIWFGVVRNGNGAQGNSRPRGKARVGRQAYMAEAELKAARKKAPTGENRACRAGREDGGKGHED